MNSQNNIVVHSKREDPFRRVPADIAENANLTYQARGLITYLIGKPVGWKINFWDLVRRSPHGKTFVRGILSELRINGFMKLTRNRNAIGEFEGYSWLLSDEPTWYDDYDNNLLRQKHLRRCSTLKRSKKFLPGAIKEPEGAQPESVLQTPVNPIPVKRYSTKNEVQEEGASLRMSGAKLLTKRTSSIRPAKPDGRGEINPTPAALASVEALKKALPEADSKALDAAYKSVPCLKLLRFWLTNFKPVFGRPCKFTEADVVAAHKLSNMEMEFDELCAAIVMMWSVKMSTDPEVHNPFWACNHYSRSLADLVKTNKGQTRDNFDRALLELNWRGLGSQVQIAWDWLEETKKHRQGLPVEKA